jgi:hypothetical protein
MTEATFEEAEQKVEKPKTKTKTPKEEPKKVPLAKPAPTDPTVTIEQVQAQLNYAQKIITILQQKVNEANGVIVQLEARIQIAQEDKENILKQVEVMGITPQ